MERTPTYTGEARLMTAKEDEQHLNKIFNILCNIQNVVISHVNNCLKNLERDKKWRATKGHELSENEKKIRKELLKKYGLTKGNLYKYAKKQRKKFEKSKSHVNSLMVQAVVDRVLRALDDYLYRDGEALHFRKRRFYKSISSKNDSTGILLRNGIINIENMEIPFFVRRNDAFMLNSLENSRIKYMRIVRRWHGSRWRYYVQFCFEGVTPDTCSTGRGTVGIDIGPSTIAIDSETETSVKELGEGINSIDRQLYLLNRKIDRQRRANNPQNYNEDGTIKKDTKNFHKHWNISKSMRKTMNRRKDLYQKRANRLTQLHHLEAKRILRLGNTFIYEDMYWAAMMKRSKKDSINQKTGKPDSKKRFGKSIQNHAPSKFLSILKTKALRNGCTVVEADCFKTCATQFDHTTGECVKHKLSERIVKVGNDDIQRDIHSAFNLRHILVFKNKDGEDIYYYDTDAMKKDYSSFKERHDTCMEEIKVKKKEGMYIPSSII